MSEITVEESIRRFEYHPPKDDSVRELHAQVHEAIAVASDHVITLTPPSREQSLAVTKLEEAMFWANAAIARNMNDI